MVTRNYDVLIVGAGCAGLTAAIGLAQVGCRILVLESASAPGANGSGGVYFTESLAYPDIIGPERIETLNWERRLVERGLFITEGHRLFGAVYRDPTAFPSCFTVLRSTFDRHLAQVAEKLGAVLLCGTTVASLIRENGRVMGVCTSRGPFHADLVFLAEGDATQLVAREGYERTYDPREAPHFLLGLHQVLPLPAAVLEPRFHLAEKEGLAYEVRLRNPSIRGRPARLNMTGYLSTNRDSLSVSLLVPADHLRTHFEGDASTLLNWFVTLPALDGWLRDSGRGPWGARLLRSGGVRDIPRIVDDGLAVGGAACTLGTDFPYLNFTGPATATGLLLTRAVQRIRQERGRYTREELERHYLQPLQKTRFWKDAEFLRHWPDYRRRSYTFFGRGIDVTLGTAELWTSRRWLPAKWFAWVRLLCRLLGPTSWRELRVDWRRFQRASRLTEVAGRPAMGRLLLDGALNALRDLFRQPRANLFSGGSLRLAYTTASRNEETGPAPLLLRRWLLRLTPVLASAARQVLANDDRLVADKLRGAVGTLVRQLNFLDLLAAAGVGFAAVLQGVCFLGLARIGRLFGRSAAPPSLVPEYRTLSSQRDDLPCPDLPLEETVLVHLVLPSAPPTQARKAVAMLQQVCPAGVFHVSEPQSLRVLPRRCVLCEACWRVTSLVDWSRSGGALPRSPQRAESPEPLRDVEVPAELVGSLDRLDQKLREFDATLCDAPDAIDPDCAEYLEMLARYAQQLGARISELFHSANGAIEPSWLPLVAGMQSKLDERSRRTWDRRFAWAAADGRQVIEHHLAGLRRLLPKPMECAARTDRTWLRVEEHQAAAHAFVQSWRDRFERASIPAAVLNEFLASLPPPTRDEPHPPLRKALLAKLGRMAPDLALQALVERDEPQPDAGSGREVVLLADLISVAAGIAARSRESRSVSASSPLELAQAASRCYLIETIDHLLSPADFSTTSLQRTSLLVLLVGDCFVADTDPALRETIAAWRQRGPDRADVRGHWPPAVPWRDSLGNQAVFSTIRQRRALLSELEQLEDLESRLAGGVASTADPIAAAELNERLADLNTRLLVARAILLRTHARLEEGLPTACEIQFLRMFIGEIAEKQALWDQLAHRAGELSIWREDRPLVDPSAGPPVVTRAEYLSTTPGYTSGDFLLLPVNFSQSRLIPEMLEVDPVLAAQRQELLATLSRRFVLPEDWFGDEIPLSSHQSEPTAHGWRSRRGAAARFLAATVAWELLGHAEHRQTRSLVLETTAVALLLALLVRQLQEGNGKATESAFGESASDDRLRKEVLEALFRDVAPRWSDATRIDLPQSLSQEALETEALRLGLRQRLEAVLAVCGPEAGSDPQLWPVGVLLAESVAWFKGLESVLHRMAWRSRRALAEEAAEAANPLLACRVFLQCQGELRHRLQRLDETLARLRRGLTAPEVRAAALLMRSPRMPEQRRG